MWYAVITEDHKHTLDKRMTARPNHVARLEALCAKGRLLVAGPHPAIDSSEPGPAGYTGSLLIVDFPSLEEAKAWVDDDPYVTAGVIHKVSVKPFNCVFP